jgi:hypothetical protein
MNKILKFGFFLLSLSGIVRAGELSCPPVNAQAWRACFVGANACLGAAAYLAKNDKGYLSKENTVGCGLGVLATGVIWYNCSTVPLAVREVMDLKKRIKEANGRLAGAQRAPRLLQCGKGVPAPIVARMCELGDISADAMAPSIQVAELEQGVEGMEYFIAQELKGDSQIYPILLPVLAAGGIVTCKLISKVAGKVKG